MLFLKKEEISKRIEMSSCIDLMRETLMDLNQGKSSMDLRSNKYISEQDLYLLMPAHLIDKGYFGLKLITIFPNNHAQGLPSHQGVILLFDANTGKELALIDCIEVTALRTAAVTAVATDLLANKAASTLGIIGAGVQARKHVESIILVRNIKKIRVWDISVEASMKFADNMIEQFDVDVEVCKDAEEVARNSQIITTLTFAKDPVIKGEWIHPGTHINAIGASAKEYRELDSDLVAKSKFYVDKESSCKSESSDFLVPFAEKRITEEHIVGEIGDVLLGKVISRANENDITVFEGMGLAVEDLALAAYLYENEIR
ncbi:ornithine cyclodeaminase family protein [Fusibacter ferrireducens]|uniref:Ornithine cyclodeaminase family protein n=1 Tax=Fusibacter ferrireducens TaxID=2785058 RepID=A0ABR9ZPA5_9FIRM|nr:ornithine cyclodeaminase family protein [Fusibacter ferrireducens]MBF4692264.1 ornithine cyclodeaminase family protein [Fusibacter ferrireducens]